MTTDRAHDDPDAIKYGDSPTKSQAEKTLTLNAFLDYLTPNPRKNIEIIVQQAVELTGGTSGAYSRLDDHRKLLCTCAGYHLPSDFLTATRPEGCVCFETAVNAKRNPVLIEDLTETAYLGTDPNIRPCHFRSFLGAPVATKDGKCGSLCVFHVKRGAFSANDVNALVPLAKALSLEEERKLSREHLATRLEWEKMLVDISTRALLIDDIGRFLDDCLLCMGQTLEVDGIFFWKYDPDSGTVSNISEWIAEGYPTQKEKLQNIPTSAFPWGMDLMREHKIFNFEDIEDIPEGREKEIMRMMNIKSILMIPLFVKKEFYGTVGFELYRFHRKWQEEDIHVLETITHIIAISIEHYGAEKALERANEDLGQRVKSRTAELTLANKRLKRKQKELLARESELEKLNKALLETNDALSVLARNIERTKVQEEKRAGRIVNDKVIPIIKKLRRGNLTQSQRAELELLASHIARLAGEFREEKGLHSRLTDSESRVAVMIKNGLKSREIAAELNISPDTVKTHRRHIRKKLNIQNQGINLSAYLKSEWQ